MNILKSLSLTFLAAILSSSLFAQDSVMKQATDESAMNYEEILIERGWDNDSLDWYVAPYTTFGSVTEAFKGNFGITVGIQKRHVFFGAFGELGDMGNVVMPAGETRSTDYGLLGLAIGIVSNQTKRLHFYGNIKGGYGFGNYNLVSGESGEETIEDKDGVYIFRPEAGVEFNITKKIRLAGHLGYDFTGSIHERPVTEDNELEKVNLGLTLRFIL